MITLKNYNILDYSHFKEHDKLMAIDLSKQQHLMLIQKNQQTNFTGNLDQGEGKIHFTLL